MKHFSLIMIIACALCLLLSGCTAQTGNDVAPSSTADTTAGDWRTTWRERAAAITEDAKIVLSDNGWEYADAFEGEFDSVKWGGVVLEPVNQDENAVLFTILGQVDGLYENDITAVMQYIFNENSPSGTLVNIFYISASGRNTIGDDDFESDVIVDAHDDALWALMYAY